MKHFIPAIYTPRLSGDKYGIFPSHRAGEPIPCEVLNSTMDGRRRIDGKPVCTIRAVCTTRESEVWRDEVRA